LPSFRQCAKIMEWAADKLKWFSIEQKCIVVVIDVKRSSGRDLRNYRMKNYFVTISSAHLPRYWLITYVDKSLGLLSRSEWKSLMISSL
jgi:hypothetical protein